MEAEGIVFARSFRTLSSAVEHCLHTAVVAGSIPTIMLTKIVKNNWPLLTRLIVYINIYMKNSLKPVTISLDAFSLELLQQLADDQEKGLDSWLARQIDSAWRVQSQSKNAEERS